MLATAAAVQSALAQQYPNQPIRLLFPSPPGGGTDFLGRILQNGPLSASEDECRVALREVNCTANLTKR